MSADKILLTGMVFYGYHGVSPEEQSLGQRFTVDLEITRNLLAAGESDDLDATLNYSRAFQLTRDVLEGPPRNLIEAVAEDVARKVLAESGVEAVRVRIMKPWAPIKGAHLSHAGVEIVRRARPTRRSHRLGSRSDERAP